MKLKSIITLALLLFVAVSVVALIVRESGNIQTDGSQAAVGNNPESRLPEDRLIVYYFHGITRCPTCLTLEMYSKEAVENLFTDELARDIIEWQIVNFDETWNEHFIQDYDLSFQSLVIVRMADGRQAEYKNLSKIWELVDDKPAFMEYVGNEINAYLTKL